MRSTERFSNRVDFYTAARPSYPAALLRFFQNELGLSPTTVVADIGSGTGLLSELFVRNGNMTFAIEPNAAMRSAAERQLGEWRNFHSIDAAAEATSLPDRSIGLITAGQAFHWFDPIATRTEFARVLKPGGHVALVWNERRAAGSPFMQAYQQFVDTHQADRQSAKSGDITGTDAGVLETFFGRAGYRIHTFDNPQQLDKQGFFDRIRSSSYMPLPPHEKYEQIMHAAGELFDAHQHAGAVQIEHDTRVYVGTIA